MLIISPMMKNGEVIIPATANPWPHEVEVAKILARAGHKVRFIPEGLIGTADIYLDGIIFEIKSPRSNKTGTIERRIKEAIRAQSRNIIISSARVKNFPDHQLKNWLIRKCKEQPQIKRMIFVDKRGKIIDIK